MKAVKIIRNIVIGIIVVVFFVFAILNTIILLNVNKYGVTEFDNNTLVIIKDEISNDKYKKGDLVNVKKVALSKLNVGDELFVYKIHDDGSASIDIGIIGEKHEQQDAISFENGSSYKMEYVAGVSEDIYSNIGGVLGVVQSRWGFLFIILVPCLLIFIYELYAIIVEIKYGKSEE